MGSDLFGANTFLVRRYVNGGSVGSVTQCNGVAKLCVLLNGLLCCKIWSVMRVNELVKCVLYVCVYKACWVCANGVRGVFWPGLLGDSVRVCMYM